MVCPIFSQLQQVECSISDVFGNVSSPGGIRKLIILHRLEWSS